MDRRRSSLLVFLSASLITGGLAHCSSDDGEQLTHSPADASTDGQGDSAEPEQALPRFDTSHVGVLHFPFVDTSRGTPANGTAPATSTRELPTDVYYPAVAEGGATESATEGAGIDASGAPYPLVVFVHGSFSTRAFSRSILEGIARAGYVVAAADFPLTAAGTPGGSSDLHVADQVRDVSFIVAQLADESTSAGLAAAVRKGGYAVVGHSTGGSVALLSALGSDFHDDKVRGAVSLAGDSCFFAPGFFRARALPLLFIAGSNDHLVPPATNAQRAYDAAGSPKALVTLLGASHMGFTDIPLGDDALGLSPTIATSDLARTLASYGDGSACEPIPPPRSDSAMAGPVQHEKTIAWTAAFLDRVLRRNSDRLNTLRATSDPAASLVSDGL